MNLDLLFAIIFYLLLFLFFLKNKKKFEVQGKIFALYKTKIGLKLMDKFSKIFPKFLKFLGIVGVVVGFLGMIAIFFILFKGTLNLLIKPDAVPVLAPVLPGIKLPGLPRLSFWHWIISIFIVATIHEFSHGTFARLYNLKIKSSGFAFLGPILAAFVEPDEKKMIKKKKLSQLSIFAAGPFSNILFFIFILLISIFLINPYANSVVEYDNIQIISLDKNSSLLEAGVEEGDLISSFNNIEVSNVTESSQFIEGIEPGDEVTIKTDKNIYTVVAKENPENKSKGYLGILIANYNTRLKEDVINKYGKLLPSSLIWFKWLLFWIYIISFGIGLFNLLPLGPIDGGRMFYTLLLYFIKDVNRVRRISNYVSILCLLLIFINLLPYLVNLFSFLFNFS